MDYTMADEQANMDAQTAADAREATIAGDAIAKLARYKARHDAKLADFATRAAELTSGRLQISIFDLDKMAELGGLQLVAFRVQDVLDAADTPDVEKLRFLLRHAIGSLRSYATGPSPIDAYARTLWAEVAEVASEGLR
jgi:hypothetical protein